MSAQPILQLRDVSKSFGGIRALADVSFSLSEGEIVALIGPNGAGKTTLVDVITGATRATRGAVFFNGEDVTRQRPFEAARGGLARTFQIVQPFPKMTVLENVAASALFGGRIRGVAEAKKMAREQLVFAGLAELAERSAASLTIAGRKRLELAKALATRPKLLLLDEVNAGLNSTEIDTALALIRRIAEKGVTILVIEHLMKVVLSLASRVLVLHHGRLIGDGPPAAMIADPHVIEAYLGAKFAQRIQMGALNG